MASECMILCRFLGQISDPPMTLLAYLPGWFFIEPCFGYGRGEELKHVFVLWLYKECSSWFTHKPEASPSSPSSPSSKRSNSEDLQCMMDHLHHKFLEKMRHTDRVHAFGGNVSSSTISIVSFKDAPCSGTERM